MEALQVQRAGGAANLQSFSSHSASSIASAARQGPAVLRCPSLQSSSTWASLRWAARKPQLWRHGHAPAAAAASAVEAGAPAKPSLAEVARTLADICNEGVLCTSSASDRWPIGASIRFAVDPNDGSPIFWLPPSAFHSQHLQGDDRCSLHMQLEQPGHRKPQCTFKGRVSKVEDVQLKQKLKIIWCRRFGEELKQDDNFHLMGIESVRCSLDIGEDGVWVSDVAFREASPDPLRECAAKIVEDMNRNHWEDLRRFCKVYAHMDLLVEEARLAWVDRLGFDMRVLTSSQEIVEVRVPFSREVIDERDARSSLTMMAQISWEYERNYNPPEIQLVKS